MTGSYFFGRGLCRLFINIMGGYRSYGAENVPASGAVLLMPNHISYLDPPIAGTALRRQVFFMAKAELFKVPVLGKCISSVGAFPVSRGTSDIGAIKKAFKLLNDGHIVNIFPEGKRSTDGKLNNPQKGALMVALKSKAVLIPTAIIGTEKSMSPMNKGIHRTRITVVYGAPINREDLDTMDPKEAYELLGTRWKEAVEGLIKQYT